ncbi:MAG: YigZ family protein [Bacteroidota bacterium]
MVTNYNTLKESGEGLYKEKGSKFIGLAIHVKNLDEVESHLNSIKKKYYDARHHCYAYILEPDSEIFRANDDGEPNHSAGDPILGQIRSHSLTFTLVVVVRYFGGTKLGVSGLINAYKTAAREAIENATIVNLQVTKSLQFVFSYEVTNEVMKLINEFNIGIQSQEYDNQCIISGTVPVKNLDSLLSKTKLLNQTGTEITIKSN